VSDIDEEKARIKSAQFRSWANRNKEHLAAYRKAYNEKNKEALRERRRARRDYHKEWLSAHPEARKEHTRRYREKNREKIQEAHRGYVRGEGGNYTEVLHRKLAKRKADLETIAGRPRPDVCEICGGPPDPKRGMHYDHCHRTGRFRGWLCRKCNLMLGNAEDDPARLRAGAAYLERLVA